jgi:hypothetical protein
MSQPTEKIYAFVDESGQEIKGALFLVSVVVTDHEILADIVRIVPVVLLSHRLNPRINIGGWQRFAQNPPNGRNQARPPIGDHRLVRHDQE